MRPPLDGLAKHDVRQRVLVPPERLAEVHAVVIGVGAVGRQVAWLLAALGVPRLTLFDHDVVNVENLAPQGYWPSDLHCAKVSATLDLCRQINPAIHVDAVPDRFKRSSLRSLPCDKKLVVFACVDSISTRRLLWEALREQAVLFLDGRISAEVLRVLAVDQPGSSSFYPTTLFTSAEAFAGSCTAKSTIFTAAIAAGLMVGQFSKWLRRLPVDADVTLNLLAMELTANIA